MNPLVWYHFTQNKLRYMIFSSFRISSFRKYRSITCYFRARKNFTNLTVHRTQWYIFVRWQKLRYAKNCQRLYKRTQANYAEFQHLSIHTSFVFDLLLLLYINRIIAFWVRCKDNDVIMYKINFKYYSILYASIHQRKSSDTVSPLSSSHQLSGFVYIAQSAFMFACEQYKFRSYSFIC